MRETLTTLAQGAAIVAVFVGIAAAPGCARAAQEQDRTRDACRETRLIGAPWVKLTKRPDGRVSGFACFGSAATRVAPAGAIGDVHREETRSGVATIGWREWVCARSHGVVKWRRKAQECARVAR